MSNSNIEPLNTSVTNISNLTLYCISGANNLISFLAGLKVTADLNKEYKIASEEKKPLIASKILAQDADNMVSLAKLTNDGFVAQRFKNYSYPILLKFK